MRDSTDYKLFLLCAFVNNIAYEFVLGSMMCMCELMCMCKYFVFDLH